MRRLHGFGRGGHPREEGVLGLVADIRWGNIEMKLRLTVGFQPLADGLPLQVDLGILALVCPVAHIETLLANHGLLFHVSLALADCLLLH